MFLRHYLARGINLKIVRTAALGRIAKYSEKRGDDDVLKEVKFIEKRLKDLQEDAATLLKKMCKEPSEEKSDRSTPYWKFLKEIQKIDEQTPTVRVEIKNIKKRKEVGDNLYRLAMDYPGFHPGDIRVTHTGSLLRIEATKQNGKDKDFVYEHDYEELLPKEAILEKLKAYFDWDNSFLIIEVPIDKGADLDKVIEEAEKLNRQFRKQRGKEKTQDSYD